MFKNKLLSLSCAVIACTVPCKTSEAKCQEPRISYIIDEAPPHPLERLRETLQVFFPQDIITLNDLQDFQWLKRVTYNINEIIDACFPEVPFQDLTLVNTINNYILELTPNILDEELSVLIRRNHAHLKSLQLEAVICNPLTSNENYKRALREYLSLTERYTVDNLFIPYLNEEQIPYAIEALIDFLQIDIAQNDPVKTKFFVEQLLENTLWDEIDFIDRLIKENNFQDLATDPAPQRPDIYSSIRQETQGRLEIRGLELPNSRMDQDKSIYELNYKFYNCLFTTLRERGIMDKNMLHRLIYWAKYNPNPTQ